MKKTLSLLPLFALASCSIIPIPFDPETAEERAARIEPRLARIRDLDFEHRVPVAEQDKETLRNFLELEIEEEWAKGGAHLESAYKKLGLIPPEIDMRTTMVDFLEDQIGGYYDPEQKRFFTVPQDRDRDDDDDEDVEADEEDEDDDDRDEEKGFEDIDQDFVIAHELTHALEDQHFDFQAADEKNRANGDASLAYTALVEGDAMDAGLDYMIWRLGIPMSTVSPTGRTIVQGIASIGMSDYTSLLEFDDKQPERREKLHDAPPVISTEVLFPYLAGWGFTNRVRSEFGWVAVDEMFRDPPESSEQVLYPERYIDRRDRPVVITLAAPPAGWTETYQDTLGLLRMRVLIQAFLEDEEIDGWDGDRYVLWQTPDGATSLGWLTVWDTESDAEDFAAAYRYVLQRRFGPDGRWALVHDGTRVAAVQEAPVGAAEDAVRRLLASEVVEQPGDHAPERWYMSALRWPLSMRSLDHCFEFTLLGDHAIDLRAHDDGYRFRLADSLALHSESNPDRSAFWLAFGLIGYTSDRTADYTFARIPLLVNWHGRDEGETRRSQFGMLLNSICYRRDSKGKEFDLLWGLLLHLRWDDQRTGDRSRILLIPVS